MYYLLHSHLITFGTTRLDDGLDNCSGRVSDTLLFPARITAHRPALPFLVDRRHTVHNHLTLGLHQRTTALGHVGSWREVKQRRFWGALLLGALSLITIGSHNTSTAATVSILPFLLRLKSQSWTRY